MHFSFFFSLKSYYSLLKLAAWSHGIEQGYVSNVASTPVQSVWICTKVFVTISNSCIPVSQETDQESLWMRAQSEIHKADSSQLAILEAGLL